MKNLRYQAFFDLAERELTPITNENFKSPDNEEYDQTNIQLSHELQYALINVCEGPALSVVKQRASPHGIETWRRLHQNFGTTSTTSSMGRLAAILEFNFNDNNLENDFVKWESEIQKFEKETTSALADVVKIAILMNKAKFLVSMRKIKTKKFLNPKRHLLVFNSLLD